MPRTPDGQEFPEKFYGRRSGQSLRDNHARLILGLLPHLRVPDSPGSLHRPASLFDPSVSEVWLEIGFGGGEHLAWQAAANPQAGIIGGEPFINGVAKLLVQVENQNLHNVRIIDDDIRPRMDQMGEATIDRAFLLFPDPWPKKRHHKRRFVNQANLDRLQRILKPGAEFRVASDIEGYIEWTLEEMSAHCGFSWPAGSLEKCTNRPADWPQTRYEAKAIRQGRACSYLSFIRK